MKSAEERAFIYTDQMTGKFPQSWKEQVALGKESFLAGYHEGIRACIEEMESEEFKNWFYDAVDIENIESRTTVQQWLRNRLLGAERMKEGG